MKKMSIFFLGLAAGLIIGWLTMWTTLPGMMITVYPSRLGFDQTIDSIQSNAEALGWQVMEVNDIQQRLLQEGQGDIDKLKVISLWKPPFAYHVLREDVHKSVSAMMPARIGVYVTADGGVKVASMNFNLWSKMFGGAVDTVMAQVAHDEHEIIKDIVIP